MAQCDESCGSDLIHKHLHNQSAEKEHLAELEAIGGWGAVDNAWIETIESGLAKLKTPMRVEEECIAPARLKAKNLLGGR